MTTLNVFDPTITVESLIPHRAPMRLLDRIVATGPDRLLATTELVTDAPFCTVTGVPACIGLEYLGQSAAAYFGAPLGNSPGQRDSPPRPGMLIASRSYRCQYGHFPAAHHLLMDIRPASAVGAAGLVKFSGTIHVLSSTQATSAGLLATTAESLSTLCDFLEQTLPFAEGDLSVYLPPAEQPSESNQT